MLTIGSGRWDFHFVLVMGLRMMSMAVIRFFGAKPSHMKVRRLVVCFLVVC